MFFIPFKKKMNLDQDAAAILSSSVQVVKRILDRRAEMDRAGLHDQSLIVLAGEIHPVPSHLVHNMLLIEGVRRVDSSVGVAMELPHNRMTRIFSETASPQAIELLEMQDSGHLEGALSLKAELGFSKYSVSDYTRFLFFLMLLRSATSTQFTDVAYRTNSYCIDNKDPSVIKSYRACNALPFIGFLANKNTGMKIRNHHMAEITTDFIGSKKHRIVFLTCGNAHIAGFDSFFGPRAEHSLSAEFRRRALPFMSVVRFQDSIFSPSRLPPNHGIDPKDLIMVSKLPKHRAYYNPITDTPLEEINAEIQSRSEEANYTNGLLERVGLGHYAHPESDSRELRQHYADDLKAIVREAERAVAAPSQP